MGKEFVNVTEAMKKISAMGREEQLRLMGDCKLGLEQALGEIEKAKGEVERTKGVLKEKREKYTLMCATLRLLREVGVG